MSQYNSKKPLRLPPCDFPKWRYGEGAKISTCHYCICMRCTGVKCRFRHKMDHCTDCMVNNDKMPVMVCNDWTERPAHMLKVERKYNRYQQLIDVLQKQTELLQSLEDRLKRVEEDNKNE